MSAKRRWVEICRVAGDTWWRLGGRRVGTILPPSGRLSESPSSCTFCISFGWWWPLPNHQIRPISNIIKFAQSPLDRRMCESANVLALEIYGGILVSITGLGRALRMRWMWWSEVGLGAENMPGMGCGGVECCGVMGCGTNHYSRVGSTHTLCNRCVSV